MRKTVAMRVAMLFALMGVAGAVVPAVASASGGPSFGPNVIVFNPSMPQAEIQSMLDAIAAQQVPNQFGTQRYAIMFEPGTYGSTTDPLVFQVGYYTQVAGVGRHARRRRDQRRHRRVQPCRRVRTGLDNFWRSVSNLTLNVTSRAHRRTTPRRRAKRPRAQHQQSSGRSPRPRRCAA